MKFLRPQYSSQSVNTAIDAPSTLNSRSDTCTGCNELAIAIGAAHGPEKDNLQKEQDHHQAKAKAGNTMKTRKAKGGRGDSAATILSVAKTVWTW